jgi:UDPglucose 6-dehydrogenase
VRVVVQGLWHLGSVTAACLAEAGHQVTGLDHDPATVERLGQGQAPVSEPGLNDLIGRNLAAGRLTFTTDVAAVASAEVVWVAHDTPVDSDDRADVDFVTKQVERLFPHLSAGTVVLISAQMPVGTAAKLETAFRAVRPGVAVSFACSPENLRLGKAIQVFTQPDRVVVGVRDQAAKARIAGLLAPITDRIEWMSVESAEMTKHALNAFLAVSVTFANEIASVCEQVGADAKEVERGLKTEMRIGPRAYLAPGSAFAGGTLARDIAFLSGIGQAHGLDLPLVASVRPSNQAHKHWARRRLGQALGALPGISVAVWGLTYKPGTDTLRRSASVELCEDLASQGVRVLAFDPAVKALPAELSSKLQLADSALAAVADASALVVATEWPEFQTIDVDSVLSVMKRKLILDPNRFLASKLANRTDVEYLAVGVPGRKETSRG